MKQQGGVLQEDANSARCTAYSMALKPTMKVKKDCLPGGRYFISDMFAPYKCLVYVPCRAGNNARHCGVQRAQDCGSGIASEYGNLCPGRDTQQIRNPCMQKGL